MARLTMMCDPEDIVSCDDCFENMMSGDENKHHELNLCDECYIIRHGEDLREIPPIR